MLWKLGKVFKCLDECFELLKLCFFVDNVSYCLKVLKSFRKRCWAFVYGLFESFSNSVWKSGIFIGKYLKCWLKNWKMVGFLFETFWKFENVFFGKVVVRKVGRVFGTFLKRHFDKVLSWKSFQKLYQILINSEKYFLQYHEESFWDFKTQPINAHSSSKRPDYFSKIFKGKASLGKYWK